MKSVLAVMIAVFVLMAAEPAHALQNGKELQSDCSRGNPFSEGYCEGFIIGVLSAHLSPWVINLQKGRTYFCIPGSVTFKQISEVVQKYMDDNPSRSRYRADINIWTAVTEAYPCDKR